MHLAYTPEQEELRRQLRAYFSDLMTPEVEAEVAAGETGGPACLEAVRKMGRDGWLGIGWPTEYGGQGRSDVEQFIFSDEAWRSGAPIPFLTINTVGKTIMEFGSEAQKRFFLPRILAGELHFSIGYTEPGAGTDLASLKTRAVKDGDEWVINGQKTFTSLASYADYIWLAARTDPDAPKHRGITIFLVPTSDPGFSFSKIGTMVSASTFHTYYDNVRVGDDAIVHGLHRGWDLIINQLNYERVSLGPPGSVEHVFDEVVEWAQDHKQPDGRRPDRRAVGADEPGPRARRLGVHPPHQLEGGVVGHGQRRRRQRHEGVRHRVLHRRLSPPHGDRRAVLTPPARNARGAAGRRESIAPSRACSS